MQQRRFRPGDVLDDYCPRERRITDHAVVAMIDDTIKQTRCCVCDAEHEFKDGKVPAQRRRKGQPALFSQVLDGLQGPHPARLSHPDAEPEPTPVSVAEISEPPPNSAAFEPLAATIVALPAVQSEVLEPSSGNGYPPIAPPTAMHSDATGAEDVQPPVEEGPVRRSLIRATLPRPEGQAPPARVIPTRLAAVTVAGAVATYKVTVIRVRCDSDSAAATATVMVKDKARARGAVAAVRSGSDESSKFKVQNARSAFSKFFDCPTGKLFQL